MDKALDFESKDCGFDSRRGLLIQKILSFCKLFYKISIAYYFLFNFLYILVQPTLILLIPLK